MTAGSEGPPLRDPDALATSSVGTALAGVGSLAWPELLAGAVSLAVLSLVIVWVRAVRALRQRRATGFQSRRLLPLLALGVAGGAAEVILGPYLLPARAIVLGAVSVGLWILAGPAGARI